MENTIYNLKRNHKIINMNAINKNWLYIILLIFIGIIIDFIYGFFRENGDLNSSLMYPISFFILNIIYILLSIGLSFLVKKIKIFFLLKYIIPIIALSILLVFLPKVQGKITLILLAFFDSIILWIQLQKKHR